MGKQQAITAFLKAPEKGDVRSFFRPASAATPAPGTRAAPTAVAAGSAPAASNGPAAAASSSVLGKRTLEPQAPPQAPREAPTGRLYICALNLSSVCKQKQKPLKSIVLEKHPAVCTADTTGAADSPGPAYIILLAEALISSNPNTRPQQESAMKKQHPNYEFKASGAAAKFGGQTANIAVLHSKALKPYLHVTFPSAKELKARVAVVEYGQAAIVGVYAPCMHVKRMKDGKSDVSAREEFDLCLFAELEKLTRSHSVVPLMGDCNYVWEDNGKMGEHAQVTRRWRRELGALGFSEPLDHEPTKPTSWPHLKGPGNNIVWQDPSSVDFISVWRSPEAAAALQAQGSGALDTYGRLKKSAERHEPEHYIHEHVPLWLVDVVLGLVLRLDRRRLGGVGPNPGGGGCRAAPGTVLVLINNLRTTQ
jgi:hypothetical protein